MPELLTNSALVIDGEPTEVLRTWKDRWFSRPWRPWVKTWMYTPKIPDPNVYRIDPSEFLFGGESRPCLVMHPAIYAKVVKALEQEKPDGRFIP